MIPDFKYKQLLDKAIETVHVNEYVKKNFYSDLNSCISSNILNDLSRIHDDLNYDYQPTSYSIKEDENIEISSYFQIDSKNNSLTVFDNGMKYLDNKFFRRYNNLSNIIIHDNITKQYYADTFENLHLLQKIDLPNTLTCIEENLFRNCTSLQQINIPDNVKYIRFNAFYNCNSLSSVTFSKSLKIIEDDAFSYCSSLNYINLPDSLEIIYDAFKHCKSLTRINIPKNLRYLGNYAFICSPIKELENEDSIEKKFKSELRYYFLDKCNY